MGPELGDNTYTTFSMLFSLRHSQMIHDLIMYVKWLEHIHRANYDCCLLIKFGILFP